MSGCKEETSQKYTTRPSVPRKANDPECQGQRFRGNDGRMYLSKSNRTGVFRWVVDDSEKIDETNVNETPQGPFEFSLASLYDSRANLYKGFLHPLPCPRISKDQVDILSINELIGLWRLLSDIYCTAIGRAESIGPFPEDILVARKIIKYLTGTRAQKKWNDDTIGDLVGNL